MFLRKLRVIAVLFLVAMVGCASTGTEFDKDLNNFDGVRLGKTNGIEVVSEYQEEFNFRAKDSDEVSFCVAKNGGSVTYAGKEPPRVIADIKDRYTIPSDNAFSKRIENDIRYQLSIKTVNNKTILTASDITRGMPGYGQFSLKSERDFRPSLAINSISVKFDKIARCINN